MVSGAGREVASCVPALSEVTRAEFERRFGDRTEAIDRFRATLTAATARTDSDPHGIRFRAGLGLGLALESEGELVDARRQLETAVGVSGPARLVPRAYVALARVAERLGDDMAAREAARGALARDSVLASPTGSGVEAREILARLEGGGPD